MSTRTNLYEVRAQRGESLRQFAALIGCSYVSVFSWERGRQQPIPVYRERLELVTGVPADVLLSHDRALLAENDESRRALSAAASE